LDTLTHALSGALLARASAPKDAPPQSLPRRVAAGFLACAAPDLDFVISYLGPVAYLTQHRGVTHSLLLLPLWALLLSWLLAKILREPRGWKAFYGVAALALAAHIAGDLITSFGTMVFAPVSDWRAGIGTTFIIDLWFTGIIVAGLLASAVLRRSKIPAVAASAFLVAYVGFQYLQRQDALEVAERYAAAQGLHAARIEAHPRPVSPFNWTVFVSDEEAHRFAHVNLLRDAPRRVSSEDGFLARLDAPYRPVANATWQVRPRYGETKEAQALAREAWASSSLDFFRWFADLPAFGGVSEGSTCVWFVDLRFLTPGRDTMPFQFGACRDAAASPWRAYKLEDGVRTLVR
jgi:inner membrane protein